MAATHPSWICASTVSVLEKGWEAHSMNQWFYEVKIRESHLDTFGHVNNATYLSLYEEARWELITQNGYGLKQVRDWGKGPVVLEATVKFQHEIGLREKIRITVETTSVKGKIMILKQRMHKEDGQVASEADFVFGLFDLKARKLIEPTTEWLKAIGANS
jgi:acyl-CoA thioester hydrolase